MNTSRCLIPFLILLFSSCLPTAFADEIKIGAQVDKTQVEAGELLTFSITLEGPIQESPKIKLISFDGFQVVSSGHSQSIRLGGGSTRTALTLSYTLAPTAVGSYSLGPVSVEYKGKMIQTQPIEVKVVPSKGRPKEKPSQAPRLEGGVVL